MWKRAVIFILIILNGHWLLAQKDSAVHPAKRIRQYVQVGYNFGGLTPFPLPNTIRKIESWSPGFSPSLGYEATYALDARWSVGAMIRFDIKAMKIQDSVQYFHTLITMDTSQFEGDFTGTNNTVCKNMYLSLPVYLKYSTPNNWRFSLGIYFAWLIHPSFSGTVTNGYIRKGNSLGEKVDIDTATFNFAEIERKVDWGLTAGIEKQVFKTFSVSGQLQWGVRPVFPSSFKGIGFTMTNIFFTLGIKKELFE